MATRKILEFGIDDMLRKHSRTVEKFDRRLWTLLDDMKETLRKEEGAGLAAPQVGVLRRAVVVDVEEGFFEFVNPKIISEKGEQCGWEGCLSVRGKRGGDLRFTRPLQHLVLRRAHDVGRGAEKDRALFPQLLRERIEHRRFSAAADERGDATTDIQQWRDLHSNTPLQMLRAVADHLGRDADGDLLRRFGQDRQTDGRVNAVDILL